MLSFSSQYWNIELLIDTAKCQIWFMWSWHLSQCCKRSRKTAFLFGGIKTIYWLMRINNFYYFFTSECNALTILNVNNRTLGMYPKYLFYLFEGNNKTENANVYDYASMISPFISVSFVLKRKLEPWNKRIPRQWSLQNIKRKQHSHMHIAVNTYWRSRPNLKEINI